MTSSIFISAVHLLRAARRHLCQVVRIFKGTTKLRKKKAVSPLFTTVFIFSRSDLLKNAICSCVIYISSFFGASWLRSWSLLWLGLEPPSNLRQSPNRENLCMKQLRPSLYVFIILSQSDVRKEVSAGRCKSRRVAGWTPTVKKRHHLIPPQSSINDGHYEGRGQRASGRPFRLSLLERQCFHHMGWEKNSSHSRPRHIVFWGDS